ncbi:MAG: hypothetical protein J5949_02130 [Oscillospiraceae bacterium]|nr:hypothetical protein [Oscillospiraceae bacterium]
MANNNNTDPCVAGGAGTGTQMAIHKLPKNNGAPKEPASPVRMLRDWLTECPILEGEAIHPDYLPAFEGWSFSITKSEQKQDILGNLVRILSVRVLLRRTIDDDEDRIRAIERLDALAAWAQENPPETGNTRVRTVAAFSSRTNAGTEEFGILLELKTI